MSASRDQLIGKRAAVAIMLVTFLFLVIGPLWIAVSGFAALVMEIPGNMPEAPGVTPRDKMAGRLPFDMPAWVHIVAILPLPVLLALVWKPARHHQTVAYGGRLLMWATPGFVAFIAGLCAFFAFDVSSWFPRDDGSLGLHWIAGVIGAATAVVGGVHAYRARSGATRRRQPRGRKRTPGISGAGSGDPS